MNACPPLFADLMEIDRQTILITIDVEDWFQVENFKTCIPFSSWPERELRVERNTRDLLDLLDQQKVAQSGDAAGRTTPSVSFFVLAWVAGRLPGLVREICARGHEVASHGCTHDLCVSQSGEDLLRDLVESRQTLEDITGRSVYGYRAPSFSINDNVLEFVRDAGYLYDSSYNSFSLHGRYGRLAVPENGDTGASGVMQPVEGLFELPVSNVRLGRRVIPWGGGAYFRLIPEKIFRAGVRRILKKQGSYVMYLHPWEIDPGQPRVEAASWGRRFRHYSNLKKTRPRLQNLIREFSNCSFVTCRDYVVMNQAPGSAISPHLKPV